MKYLDDKRIVMTLDAGGTNFVFSAFRGNNDIIEHIVLPSNGHNLEKCLTTIVEGFSLVKNKIGTQPSAISFAFPGPADYPRGIIKQLNNLPAFTGGVALGPMLEEKFNLPVYINNDGNLYAYGEAIAGFLPYINNLLEKAGNTKRYKNLVGLTLGTGFGAGIISDGRLIIGDNSCAAEVGVIRNRIHSEMNAEESVSIRGIQRIYSENANIIIEDVPSPKEIYEIGMGKLAGNRAAAIEAFKQMAIVLGDALANVLTLIDGLAVIGGGISGAYPLFLPEVIKEMNREFTLFKGKKQARMQVKTFNLEDENEIEQFIKGDMEEIQIPGTNKKTTYDPLSRVGVGISKIGTAKAVGIGAYAFALHELDQRK